MFILTTSSHHFDDEKLEWVPVLKDIDVAAEMKKSAAKDQAKWAQAKAAQDKAKAQKAAAVPAANSVPATSQSAPKKITQAPIVKAPPGKINTPPSLLDPIGTYRAASSDPREALPELQPLQRQELEAAKTRLRTKEEMMSIAVQDAERKRQNSERKAAELAAGEEEDEEE